MKVLYAVCFLLALWLVMVPLPCTGSPEAVSSDEINPSTLRPEGRSSLRIDPEQHFFTPS